MKKQIVCLLLSVLLLLTACAKGPTWQEQYDLGVRYLSDGNYQEAIIAFTAAIEIDPKRVEAYMGRGDAYFSSGESEESLAAAQADYKTVIELDESYAQGYLSLADAYMQQGALDAAVELLQTALEKTGQDQAIADKLGEIEASATDDQKEQETPSDSEIDYGYSECTYDELGRPIREDYYNAENVLYLYNIMIYDEQGRLIRRESYNPDGVLQTYAICTYDDSENSQREDYFNADGTSSGFNVYFYDEYAHLLRQDFYNGDGILTDYDIHTYDEQGNWLGFKHYNADGTLNDSRIYGD